MTITRELAPWIALASIPLALILPRLLRSPRSRAAAVMQRVLRGPVIMAAGMGTTFAMMEGARFGAQGAVLGAAIAYGAIWVGTILQIGWEGRAATLLERVRRSHACFGAGAALVALGAARLLLDEDGAMLRGEASTAAIAVGTLLLFGVWIRDSWLLHRTLGAGRDAKPIAEGGPVRAGETIYLGLGDERWIVEDRPGSPYRDGRSGALLFVGRLLEVLGRVSRIVLGRTVAVFVALIALHAALQPARPRERPRPSDIVPPPPPPPAPEPERTDTRTWVGWYPQPGPIIEDLDRDGTEDVIGLRWDSSRQAAALSVVATSGKTFKSLWSSEPIPAQWYSRATHLARSGEALFMTDSEGLLRVFDLRTGAVRARISAPRSDELCASPEGEEQVYAASWDPEAAGGLLVDARGNTESAKRPSWCRSSWERAQCPRKDGAPCSPAAWPPFLSQVAQWASPLEEGDVGLATAGRKHPKKDAPKGMDVLFGYDPKTRAKRFEAPIPFTDEELHRSPSLSHTMRAGRFFAYYQLRSGKWMLGARDGRTGEALWSQTPPRTEHGTEFRGMVATATRLYVALDSRLEVLDAATGASIGVIW
ncbi:MAG: hypothetical protein IT372_14565 [Polyangiaceae bacterium]|nr:hypothetical protein [Polyangiaceae bacterium]